MQFWWVNKGKSWPKPKEGGYLWAPLETKESDKMKPYTVWHWDTMKDVKKNDMIFCYTSGKIVAVAQAKGTYYRSDQPNNLIDEQWRNRGRRIDATYTELKEPIIIKDHWNKIKNFRINDEGFTILEEKKQQAAQFYLANISYDFGQYLMQFVDKESLFYNESKVGSTERIKNGKKKVVVEVTRVVRDTELSKEIKELYDYRCQICNISIKPTKTEIGKYVEAAHIKPLSQNGDDLKNNIICLCPNHHTMLDYGSISILDDLTVIGLDNAMIHTKHSLNKDNFKWHRDNIFIGNI